VEAQTHDGRKVRLMTLIHEFTREYLAIRVARRINSLGVLDTMADVMLVRGILEHIRSDNGPEMTAKIVRGWLASVGAKTLYIEPGSPWENGYMARLRCRDLGWERVTIPSIGTASISRAPAMGYRRRAIRSAGDLYRPP